MTPKTFEFAGVKLLNCFIEEWRESNVSKFEAEKELAAAILWYAFCVYIDNGWSTYHFDRGHFNYDAEKVAKYLVRDNYKA